MHGYLPPGLEGQELTSGSKPPQTLTSEEMGLLQAQGDAAV